MFLRNGRVEDNQDVKNGLFGNITSINGNIVTVKTLEKENSREINIDITKYNNFDYGYATTVHKAQGATVENSLLFVNSKGWNRNLTYVGMSRHKENLDVYVNKAKYKDLDSLKRGLSSKSNKELNVAEFIERKHPANFFDRIKQSLGLSEKYQIKDTNHLGLGVSKELYNDLVKYSKKVLETSQNRRNFEKIREKNSLAEIIYNKHQTEINSKKDIKIGVVRLPDASKRIIENKADKNDISRICKGIAEAYKSQEMIKSQAREESLSRNRGNEIGS
ncbi:hypothetical protein AB9G26_09340 [Francisella philomiragia]|uniref:hypothetical protein n=1 Tax=Francisella philomiragia TaxID=28110 RepID=UPI00351534CB